jgi:hypothetical protein
MTIAALSQNVDFTPRLLPGDSVGFRPDNRTAPPSAPPPPPSGGDVPRPADVVALSDAALAVLAQPGQAPVAAIRPIQGSPPPRPGAAASAVGDQGEPAAPARPESREGGVQDLAPPPPGLAAFDIDTASGSDDARTQIASAQADVQARSQPQRTFERALSSQFGPVTTASAIAADVTARAAAVVGYNPLAMPEYGASLARGNAVNAIA